MITHSFGIVNYLVLFGYLLAMMLVGVYFSRRQKTADDYFRGGGRVPGWAAGVSVFATTLSSITFMSIPAKAFTSDWTFIIGQYLAIAILPLVFYFYMRCLPARQMKARNRSRRRMSRISPFWSLPNRFFPNPSLAPPSPPPGAARKPMRCQC